MSASVLEELQALDAIYGAEIERGPAGFRVAVHEHCALRVTLPPDYPTEAPPSIETETEECAERSLLTASELAALRSECDGIWRARRPDVCCYEIIEHCRAGLEDKRTAARNAAAAASATGTERPSRAVNVFHYDEDSNDSDDQSDQALAAVPEVTPNIAHTDRRSTKADPSRHHSQFAPTFAPQFTLGESIVDRKSVFLPYYCAINSEAEARAALLALHSDHKLSKATHIITAYKLPSTQSCDDDGETAAGGRLLHLLNVLHCEHVLVAVARWYGGTPLGAARFKHINNAARQVLEQAGVVTKGKQSRR